MSELLPCPFCGEVFIEGPQQKYIERAAGYGYTVYNVGHAQLSSSRKKCIAWVTSEYKDEAIERWNARTLAATAPTVAVDEKPTAEDYDAMLREFCCNYAAGGYNSDGLIDPATARAKLEWIVDDAISAAESRISAKLSAGVAIQAHIGMSQVGVGESAHGYVRGWNDCVDAMAAPSPDQQGE